MSTEVLHNFLLARIADRESVARDMQDQARLGRPFFDVDSLAGGTGIRELVDPTRVLAECQAQRRMIWFLDDLESYADRVEALHILSAAHVSHEDYDESWAVSGGSRGQSA